MEYTGQTMGPECLSLHFGYTNAKGKDMLQISRESFPSHLLFFIPFIPLSPSILSPAFPTHHIFLPVLFVS
jgi:hypothetical protein